MGLKEIRTARYSSPITEAKRTKPEDKPIVEEKAEPKRVYKKKEVPLPEPLKVEEVVEVKVAEKVCKDCGDDCECEDCDCED